MPDKITALTENTAPLTSDIIPMVDDPGGSPLTQKITFANALKVVNGLTEDTAPDTAADFLLSYDTSAGAMKKVTPASLLVDARGTSPNLLLNGDFSVNQRLSVPYTSATTPANSDDTYLLDRWILLSDGNDIVDVSQSASATIADPQFSCLLDVETANKKFGILQIIEKKDARQAINKAVSLSFKAKITGTSIGAIRAGVLSWSSTADAVTSDVVSAWGAAGTNPTLVANWTFENTPAALTAPTTSWQTYTIENISIDTASAANIAVFIWVDDTVISVADLLYIADVKLEVGANATEFEFVPYAEQLYRCRRFCERVDNIDAYSTFGFGLAASTTKAQFSFPFSGASKFGIQTYTFSAGSTWLVRDGVDSTAVSSIAAASEAYSANSVRVAVTVASGLTQYRPMFLVANNQAAGAAYVIAVCEL